MSRFFFHKKFQLNKNSSKPLISIGFLLAFKFQTRANYRNFSLPPLYCFVFWSRKVVGEERRKFAPHGARLHRHPSLGGADRRHAPRIFHCSVKSEARCATRRAVLSRALVPTVSRIRDSTGISQVTSNLCNRGGGKESWLIAALVRTIFPFNFWKLVSSIICVSFFVSTNINARDESLLRRCVWNFVIIFFHETFNCKYKWQKFIQC